MARRVVYLTSPMDQPVDASIDLVCVRVRSPILLLPPPPHSSLLPLPTSDRAPNARARQCTSGDSNRARISWWSTRQNVLPYRWTMVGPSGWPQQDSKMPILRTGQLVRLVVVVVPSATDGTDTSDFPLQRT